MPREQHGNTILWRCTTVGISCTWHRTAHTLSAVSPPPNRLYLVLDYAAQFRDSSQQEKKLVEKDVVSFVFCSSCMAARAPPVYNPRVVRENHHPNTHECQNPGVSATAPPFRTKNKHTSTHTQYTGYTRRARTRKTHAPSAGVRTPLTTPQRRTTAADNNSSSSSQQQQQHGEHREHRERREHRKQRPCSSTGGRRRKQADDPPRRYGRNAATRQPFDTVF